MPRELVLGRRGLPVALGRVGAGAPPPPPGGGGDGVRDFFSDWRTAALGTGGRTDNGKWNVPGGSGLSVIESTGLDFPSARVLRVAPEEGTAGFAFLRRTGLPIPGEGGSRYYRGYIRVSSQTNVAVADPETHPHQDGNAASQINWGLWVYHNVGGPGKWTLQVRPNATVVPFPFYRFELSTPLDKDVTYRWELRVERVGGGYRLDIRIYSTGNILLFDSSNFLDQRISFAPLEAQSLAQYMATNTFSFFNLANLDGLNAGLNGLGGSDWFPTIIHSYQGCLATGVEDWIGPYDEDIG